MTVCKFCGSTDTIKSGIYICTRGRFQRYKCKGCGRNMIGGRKI